MAEYTLHTVYASICSHTIRHSSQLPAPDASIDDTVPFCSNCEVSIQLEAKYESCKAAYDSLVDEDLADRKLLRQARNQYIAAKVALLQQEDRNRHRLSPQRRDSGLPGIGQLENKLAEQKASPSPELARKSVRFDEAQHHRTEGQKRFEDEFLRGSKWYSPGKWADRSGRGYINTSNPYKKPGVQESTDDSATGEAVKDVEEGMIEVGGEGDAEDWKAWEDQGEEDEDLELLTDEQLQERFRQVEAQLAKLRQSTGDLTKQD